MNITPQEEMEQLLNKIKLAQFTLDNTDDEYFEEDTLVKLNLEIEKLMKSVTDMTRSVRSRY